MVREMDMCMNKKKINVTTDNRKQFLFEKIICGRL